LPDHKKLHKVKKKRGEERNEAVRGQKEAARGIKRAAYGNCAKLTRTKKSCGKEK